MTLIQNGIGKVLKKKSKTAETQPSERKPGWMQPTGEITSVPEDQDDQQEQTTLRDHIQSMTSSRERK
ncbi:MAG: hypothetical protein MZV63_52775 [Marinilabiliales bacterium]|nr:hypothetical protein [Marinilabiliales bacterium]